MNWKLLKIRLWWARLRLRHWLIYPVLRYGFRKNHYYTVEGVWRGKGVYGLPRPNPIRPGSLEEYVLEHAKTTIVPSPLLTAEQFFEQIEKGR